MPDPSPAVNLSHGVFHSRLKVYMFYESSSLVSLLRTELTE